MTLVLSARSADAIRTSGATAAGAQGYMAQAKLAPDVWDALQKYAAEQRQPVETIIAEAVRAYVGPSE